MAIIADTRLLKMKFVGLLLIAVVLTGIFLASAVLSMSGSLTIGNSGKIAVPSVACESEIRAVFIHSASLNSPNFDTIANTLATYSINTVVIEWGGNNWMRYSSNFTASWDYNLTGAVNAFHAKNMAVYAMMNVLGEGAYTGDGVDRRVWAIPGSGNIGTIAPYNWLEPCNPASQTLLKNLAQEIVSNFNIEGFMFDYTRWGDGATMPYDPYAKAQFISDTGLTDVSWPADVVQASQGGTGKYWSQFLEWRCNVITTLVGNMRSWMLAINPNLKIAAAPWDFGSLSPIYWRYWLGQDAARWISLGYLDWIAPQMYGNFTTASSLLGWEQWALGGAHGRIQICPFIADQMGTVYNPSDVARMVNLLRTSGGDGFLLFRYGGPGDGTGDSNSPDIRPYLSAIGLPSPSIFSLGSIAATAIGNSSAVVTWTTSSAATSLAEYNSSALFAASFLPYAGFNYWQMNHINGTIIYSSTAVTSHSITLTGLASGVTYYFRVQSQDPSGTATSKVLTFETA